MREIWLTASIAVFTTAAIAGTFPSPPLYPSFAHPAVVKFTSFDPKGSQGTSVVGINAGGTIAGNYQNGNQVSRGFVRSAGGRIVTFDVSDDGTKNGQNVSVAAINRNGDVAGVFATGMNPSSAFVRNANGAITTFIPPKSSGTDVAGINNDGTVVGWFTEKKSFVVRSFLRRASGKITIFDEPHAFQGESSGTVAAAINDAGTITGRYNEGATSSRGFVRTASGVFTEFRHTGTAYIMPTGINSAGTICGFYLNSDRADVGFVRAPDGKFTSFNVPHAGTQTPEGTMPSGIDSAGDIVGYYATKTGALHGFLRKANGTVSEFNLPNDSTKALEGTNAVAINDDGTIAGDYNDKSGVLHGFVRSN